MAKRENGAQFPETSDIDNLKNSLSDLTDASLSRRQRKQLGSIIRKPGLSDFERYLGNLDMIVPMGFWMVHNDLEKLQEIVEKSTGSESKGGSGVASAITAVATTVSAATDLLEVIKSPAGLGDILNNEEINDLLAKDPTVYDIRLAGTQAYLKAYYSNLINNLGYDLNWDENTVIPTGVSLGSVLKDIGDAVGGSIGAAVESVMQALQNSDVQKELESTEDVQNVRKVGYGAYLKAYYANMIQPMGYTVTEESLNTNNFVLKREDSLASVLKDISGFLTGFVGGYVESIATSVTDSAANALLNTDENIIDARKAGYLAYIKAYYANMIQPMGYAVTEESLNDGSYYLKREDSFASVANDIVDALTSFTGSYVSNLANAVTDASVNALLNFNDDVKATRVKGYKAYLKAYYANMIKPMGYLINETSLNGNEAEFSLEEHTSGSSVISSITEAIGKGAGNLVGAVANLVTDSVANGVLNGDDDIKDIRKKGYSAYLRAYYANMLSAFGYDVDLAKVNNNDFSLQDTSYNLKDAWSDFTSAAGQGFANFINGLTSGSLVDILPESAKSDPEALSIAREGYKKILSAYYDAFDTEKVKFNDGTIDNDYREIKNSFVSSLKDGFKSYAEGSIDFNENNIIEIDNDEILGKMDDLVKAVSDNNVKEKLDYIQVYTGAAKDSLATLNSSIEKLIEIMESKDYGSTTIVNNAGGASSPIPLAPRLTTNGSMF